MFSTLELESSAADMTWSRPEGSVLMRDKKHAMLRQSQMRARVVPHFSLPVLERTVATSVRPARSICTIILYRYPCATRFAQTPPSPSPSSGSKLCLQKSPASGHPSDAGPLTSCRPLHNFLKEPCTYTDKCSSRHSPPQSPTSSKHPRLPPASTPRGIPCLR